MSPKAIRQDATYYRTAKSGARMLRTVIRINRRAGDRWGRFAATVMYTDGANLCTQKLGGFARWAQGEEEGNGA